MESDPPPLQNRGHHDCIDRSSRSSQTDIKIYQHAKTQFSSHCWRAPVLGICSNYNARTWSEASNHNNHQHIFTSCFIHKMCRVAHAGKDCDQRQEPHQQSPSGPRSPSTMLVTNQSLKGYHHPSSPDAGNRPKKELTAAESFSAQQMYILGKSILRIKIVTLRFFD